MDDILLWLEKTVMHLEENLIRPKESVIQLEKTILGLGYFKYLKFN